ncbi:MAG TPA: hypothetical protein VM029_19015 [Opitutaceae bacterium]|nr:hypothetical protein [Opitutaceae bacterium]
MAFFSDDVEAIAYRILVPFEKGTLQAATLFTPHNGDHVIFLTRVWEILWFKINGEWDVQLMMFVKVPVFAAAMTIFIHLFTSGMLQRRYFAAAVLTVLFAFPFNYHNLLWAFQSQFDFLFLTAALGWLALVNDRVVLALVCAFIAPFALGAGPVVAASYVPYFLAAGFLTGSWPKRKALGYAAIAIAIAAFGASFPDQTAQPHGGTLVAKIATLLRLCAWPFSNLLSAIERLPELSGVVPRSLVNFPSAESSWMLWFAAKLDRYPVIVMAINFTMSVLMLAPLAVLAAKAARLRSAVAVARGPLNVCGFAGLIVVATAIARTDMNTIAIRFIDHVSLVGFASVAAAFILAAQHPRARSWLAGWGVIVGCAYFAMAGATMSQMVSRRNPEMKRDVIQRYYAGVNFATGVGTTNHAAFLEHEAARPISFMMGGDETEFMRLLDNPDLWRVLPQAIKAPGSPRGRAAAVALVAGRFGLLIAGLAAMGAAWIAFRARPPTARVAPVIVPGTAA